MAETTEISWADATLSLWVGCTKVSVGDQGACEFCYAEGWAKRWPAFANTWGTGAARVLLKNLWEKARAIERKGRRLGQRQFVFQNSLSDILDNEVPIEWLVEALKIAEATPHNIYLWLTKRAAQMMKRLIEALKLAGLSKLPGNIALGITVVTQAEADRDLGWLLKAKAALAPLFVFLSIEPMRGRIDLQSACKRWGWSAAALDWVICGMESGPRARPGREYWAALLREQCAAWGIPFHFKQWGEWAPAGYAVVENKDMRRWRDLGRPEIFDAGAGLAICIGNQTLVGDHAPVMRRVGKKAAGRLLDGVLHDARPEVAHAL